MQNSSAQSSSWNDMTSSSSICKARPAESRDVAHEKHHHSTAMKKEIFQLIPAIQLPLKVEGWKEKDEAI